MGAIIGKHRILKKLGQGGMGEVYLAEHTLMGQRVAIKVLLPEQSTDKLAVERFFHEACAVGQIADPGIVKVFDFGQSDGRAYLIMELLEGEPMEQRLARQGRFSIADAMRFARQICTSLAAAHAGNIVHRDLKPENLFIIRDAAVVVGGERIKILDFGLAKRVGTDARRSLTRTGIAIGTPQYMSPEQCRGQGEIDHRSDVYALGCVMFVMLTGAPPFTYEAGVELLAAHLRESPPLASSRVPELSGAIDEMLRRCLEKSPAARFASMTELVAAIDAAGQAPTRAAATTVRIDPEKAGVPVAAPTMPDGHAVKPRAATATRPDYVALDGPLEGHNAASTLTEAVGQRTARLLAPEPPRWRWLAILVVAVLLTGGAVFVVRPRAGAPSAPMPEAVPGGESAAGLNATVVAAPSAPSAPVARPAAVIEDAEVAILIDAGVTAPVAVPPLAEPRDAAPAAPERRKSSHKGARQQELGGEHANSTGSDSRPVIDRGD